MKKRVFAWGDQTPILKKTSPSWPVPLDHSYVVQNVKRKPSIPQDNSSIEECMGEGQNVSAFSIPRTAILQRKALFLLAFVTAYSIRDLFPAVAQVVFVYRLTGFCT
jgi:hypothetical protein